MTAADAPLVYVSAYSHALRVSWDSGDSWADVELTEDGTCCSPVTATLEETEADPEWVPAELAVQVGTKRAVTR